MVTIISVPGGLQDQSPVASAWQNIIFDARIKIQALKNLPLDIYQGN